MHRISEHGSYRLDRIFPGVGRIAVASGATTAAEFKSRNELLTRLYNKGRLDLLRAISHFLADQLGDVHHPWRRAVIKVFPKGVEVERTPDLTPEVFWAIVRQTPEYIQAAYVTIAALGLGVGEYLRLTDTDLLPHTMQVRIPGTKTAGSAATLKVDERLWPWIQRAVPSPLKYRWLRLHWVRACQAVKAGDLRLYDLRHCYGQWLSDEGVPEARIRVGMRHATASMTRRYTKQRDKGENAKAIAEVMCGSA